MGDPTRLVEKRGLAGTLLRAGAEELPSRDHVRKVALAIGAGAVITSSSAAAAGAVGMATGAGSALSNAGGPATLAVLGKWLGIGTLTGLLTVTSAVQVERMRSRSAVSEAPVPTTIVAARSVAPVAVDVPAPPEVEATSAPPSKPFVAPVQPVAPRAKTIERPPSEPVADRDVAPVTATETSPLAASGRINDDVAAGALAPEIAFVDRAWQAMQRRDHDRALSELAPYELRFPDLRLHPEVLFLRMEAERQLGHTDNAVALARQIVAAYPKSAQAAPARSILGSR
jgi:hypothetical protein